MEELHLVNKRLKLNSPLILSFYFLHITPQSQKLFIFK